MVGRTLVDRGGTFTDVVHLDANGHVSTMKVPSDQAVVGDLAEGALTFGTTVATNALLEGKGKKVLLLVTEGFEDLPSIGDQSRPYLFDSDRAWPTPFTLEVRGVPGRLDAEGNELEPTGAFDATDFESHSIAIVLLNSHRNGDHERAYARFFPGQDVVLGHVTSPLLGYLDRLETALVDAAITPVLRDSMIRDKIGEEALAIRSDGSLVKAEALRAPEAVLSGPAGGILAVSAIAKQAGFASAVGLDMGGTSTDICRVDADQLPFCEEVSRVAGVRIRRPMYEIETIAAGGGSILRSDGLRLRVGPDSAGAHPGPQCYGRGGPPTLTDAVLEMNLLDETAFDPPLNRQCVELPGAAEEFVALARESMAHAVRKLALARGRDVRNHALIAYGGAAGQHAAKVAELLGITTVIFHPCAAVLCAYGQSLAVEEEHRSQAVWSPLEDCIHRLDDEFNDLRSRMSAAGAPHFTVALRLLGTDHALDIPYGMGVSAAQLEDLFGQEHHRRYGFTQSHGKLEVVNLTCRVVGDRSTTPAIETDPWGLGTHTVEGPELITTHNTAIELPDGWHASLRHGLLFLKHVEVGSLPTLTDRTPFGVELWANRFASVAEEGGEVLRRLARSVNIRRRLDFSMGVFDEKGRLVANAPHIPVHLGSMGHTVRDLIENESHLAPGQAWLTNDPQAGGSHLPDLTVISPVKVSDRLFFIASRAHHVDIGGITAGSMPPHSTCLAHEGRVYRRELLKDGEGLKNIQRLVRDSRQPDTVQADLLAQIAANHHASRLLSNLGTGNLLAFWMGILADVADESIDDVLRSVKRGRAFDVLGEVPLRVSVSAVDKRLRVDFSGTGGPHAGNLNAPFAVVRAAILYVLRVLAARDIPLNEGTLRRLDLVVPSPSLLCPSPEAAVVGGNVETSQRLVDLLLNAFGARASSQGTMNNLVLSGDSFSLYETIGGGLGATSERNGADGRQVHMTNTRATDPEVLEARFPLRLRHFRYRPGTGGAGRRHGGSGLSREFEVCGPTTATLLATRRDHGAPGFAGGEAGATGEDSLCVGGRWKPWDGQEVTLQAGDRVRVQTPGGGGWGALDSD
jgi:5-oxoprolinase (ATP-hydrolysing)